MKKFISRLLIIGMLFIPVIGVTSLTTGCNSLGTQQQAVLVEYNSLSAVVNVVDLARGIYDDLYQAGKVSQTLDDRVAAIYIQYQRVANLAIKKASEQAAAANAGTVVTTNEYIAQLQDLINQLLLLFNQAPEMPQQKLVVISKNSGI